MKKNNLIYNVKASPQKYIIASLQLNKKIEEIEMNIKNGDTTVNVKINTTAKADEDEDPTTGASSNPRRLFFGAMNLLKMGR